MIGGLSYAHNLKKFFVDQCQLCRIFYRTRQRRGHLCQGRSNSILVDADEYLKQLSRYIHLNPMRAKMVEKYFGNISGAGITVRYNHEDITVPGVVAGNFQLPLESE
jgi:hypothetical protein